MRTQLPNPGRRGSAYESQARSISSCPYLDRWYAMRSLPQRVLPHMASFKRTWFVLMSCRCQLVGRRVRHQPLPGLGSTQVGPSAWSLGWTSSGSTSRRTLFGAGHPPRLWWRAPCVAGSHHTHVVEMSDDNIRDFEHIIRATIKQYAISWTLCQRTLRRIINVLEEAELEQTKETVDHMKHCLISLCSSRAWPFLLHHQLPVHGRFDLAQIEEDFDHALIEPTQPEIPHPCTKERIFLHVFSGRRREGDLQFFMEKLYDQLCADGTTLCVVSLDLIIDQQWGNVRQETTQNFWLEGVKAGWVCGCTLRPTLWDVVAGSLRGRSPRPTVSTSTWSSTFKGHLRAVGVQFA